MTSWMSFLKFDEHKIYMVEREGEICARNAAFASPLFRKLLIFTQSRTRLYDFSPQIKEKGNLVLYIN